MFFFSKYLLTRFMHNYARYSLIFHKNMFVDQSIGRRTFTWRSVRKSRNESASSADYPDTTRPAWHVSVYILRQLCNGIHSSVHWSAKCTALHVSWTHAATSNRLGIFFIFCVEAIPYVSCLLRPFYFRHYHVYAAAYRCRVCYVKVGGILNRV